MRIVNTNPVLEKIIGLIQGKVEGFLNLYDNDAVVKNSKAFKKVIFNKHNFFSFRGETALSEEKTSIFSV